MSKPLYTVNGERVSVEQFAVVITRAFTNLENELTKTKEQLEALRAERLSRP